MVTLSVISLGTKKGYVVSGIDEQIVTDTIVHFFGSPQKKTYMLLVMVMFDLQKKARKDFNYSTYPVG